MQKKWIMLAALGLTAMSHAVVVDDFEGYTVGDTTVSDAFTGGTWAATSSGANTAIEAGNYLSIGGGFAKGTSRGLGSNSLADGASGTYYYQVSSGSYTVDYCVGLSGDATVTGWNSLAAYAVLAGNGSDTLALRARDGNGTSGDLVTGLSTDTWYDIWLVVDNSANTYDMYYGTGLGSGGMGSATLLADDFAFRSDATSTEMTTFGIYGQLSDNNAFRVDNIEAIPEPATIGLVAMCGGALLIVRRRLAL